MEVVKGRGYVYSIQYHIVWCVKYRRNILNGQVATRLKELLTQISKDNGVSKDILSLCDEVIKINMNSKCESLNVAVSSGIVLYNLWSKNE